MAARHDIYLVPGFFGFADLGGVTYFHHVREHLGAVLERAGIDARIHSVPTLPTASIRRRASLLLECVASTADDAEAPIHLVGHSTGGLDTRLFATPGAALETDIPLEPYAS